jgi:hypothetical protein
METKTKTKATSIMEFTSPASRTSLTAAFTSSQKVSIHHSQPRGFMQTPPASSSSLRCSSSPSTFSLGSSPSSKLRGRARRRLSSLFPEETAEREFAEFLPLEIIAVVLRYCDSRTVVRCSRVCCSFYSLARDESLWRRLYFRDFLYSSNSNNSVNIGRKQQFSKGEANWKELYVRQYLQTKHGSFLQKTSIRCDYGLSYEVISYHYDTDILVCRSEVLKVSLAPVYSLSVSHSISVSSSFLQNLHIFKIDKKQNAASASCIHTIGGGRECPILCASSNGYYVAGGSNRGVIHIWLPETATKVTSLFGHSDNIISLRFCEEKLAR